MTSLLTPAPNDKRALAAAALITDHLNNRDQDIIKARQTRTGVMVFLVAGSESDPYVVSLEGVGNALASSCSCRGWQFRGHCKHLDAVRAIVGPSEQPAQTTAPAPLEWHPAGGWSSTNRRKAGRVERVEEV